MTTTRTRILVVALCCVAALGFCADAGADSGLAAKRGVLSISPARRDIAGRPPLRLVPTEVKNTTQTAMQVRVFPVLLFQNLDGSFGFNTTPVELNEARLQLSAGPTRFTMNPQTAKTIALRWQLLPRKAKAAYLGLVIQGVPQLPGKRSLGTVLRLLSVNFLRLPGHWKITGRLTRLRGEQAAPRVLVFRPRVRNTGQIHSQPLNGRCRIADSHGRLVVRSRSFGTGVILPGYEREYPITIKKPTVLPAGSYVMKCATRFGTQKSTRSLRFRLSGPNTLPTPNLKLTSVKANGQIGGSGHVQIAFRNRGSAASTALLKVSLKPVGGSAPPRVLARVRVPEGSIAAGASKTASVDIGNKLAAGTYVADVILNDGKQDVDELTSSFTATKHKGLFARIWDWLKDNIAWLIALLALIAFLILFLLYRRRRREMEEELEATRQGAGAPATASAEPMPAAAPISPEPPPPTPPAAPVPPAPIPPAPSVPPEAGRVNLNSASVEQLMTLPGVGRRAAQRIVEYRESNGPFTSLDDLRTIEGFHAERIKRLAGSVDI